MIRAKRLYKSFKYALRGFVLVLNTEQSFQVQMVSAAVVLFASFYFKITMFEWIVVFLLIGAILSLEMINSILERIVDTFKPRIHPVVRDIKDMMAATVLIVSFISILIGITIFWPHIYLLVFG